MQQEKNIRTSKRGLTFSFAPTAKLTIGTKYSYIINKSERSIRIVPDAAGTHTISRKRRGDGWTPLVDIRSKEVLAAIAEMESIRVSISQDTIVVTSAKKKTRGMLLRFPRVAFAEMRKAAGMENAAAVGALMDCVQITFDDILGMDVGRVCRDLPDVYTVVSLFSGAGVLDWPFAKDSRFDIRYAIDYEASACETYRANIGDHIVHGDIHKAFTENGYALDKAANPADIVIGGPSCKPFSNANRHTRLEDHPDSDLVLQYLRIVEKLRPKVFAMENVPEVLTACNGAYYKAIKDMAEQNGYHLGSRIVCDDKLGGYTTRKRAIIIGSRVGPVFFSNISLVSGKHTVGEAFAKIDASWSNLDDVTLPGAETKKRMSFVPQGGNYESIPQEYRTGSKNRHSCTYRRLSLSEPSPTIVNWRKPPLIHPTEDRTLTVAEAKALQGLPGSFRVLGSLGQKQQQIGNAVPVAIGQYVKQTLLALLESANVGNLCTAAP